MKKLILLLITALTAHAANYDLRYLQENASGKIVERTVTLTPSTFLSVSANGTLQVQSSTDFRTSLGLGTAATSNSTAFLASSNGTATNLTLNGTTTFGNATQARTALGLGTLASQNGTYGNATELTTGTLAAARLPNLTLNLSGALHNTPVTFTAGVGNATLANQTVNTVLAGPSSGNSTTPTFRSLVISDLAPALSGNVTTGNLTVNGTLTANGSVLTSLNGTQITTGTLAAARLPNLTLNLSGTLHNTPVTFTAGVGNATLANQSANTFFAGPSSGNATAPTFRALTSSDLPTSLALSGTANTAPNQTAASGASLMTRDLADVRYPTGLMSPIDILSRYQVMTPQIAATTAPGAASLNEQYGWGADIATGVGSNGRGAANFGNPSPFAAVNYGTRTVELFFQLTMAGLDANANLWVQFGTTGTNIQPLANTDRGFGIRTNGNSTSQVVCMVANGTTLTESSPITVPGSNLLIPIQFRIISTPGGNDVFYARLLGETTWTTLWTTALGPTVTTSQAYQCVSAVAKATGTTTTSTRGWIRSVLFGIY